jgi:sugar fermentation stimulation protein A
MKSCSEPGRPVRLSYHPHAGRKHAFSLEMIRMDDGWVGVNTGIPNGLSALAAQYGLIPDFISYPTVRREVRFGVNSRVDLLLEGPPGLCYVEVKSVSYLAGDGLAFPDAVTERGTKHLEELQRAVREGHRAALLFIVQRPGGAYVRPADEIDPVYGETLRRAVDAGVEVLAYRAEVTPEAVRWGASLPVRLS